TVVSLEHAIAAPYCTRQLADQGARVIKIERPGSGDFARGYDERVRGLASHFVWPNRSKESLTLGLKSSGATDVPDRLLDRADVLVQNLAPGASAITGEILERAQCGDASPLPHQLGHARRRQALTLEKVFGVSPPLAFFADQTLARHAHVVEKDLVDMMPAIDGTNRSDFDARGIQVDQKQRDAFLLARAPRGPCEEVNAIGFMSVRGPDLLAADDVVVAVRYGRRAEGGQIGTGARLGITLAPPVGGIQDARQEAGFLFF